MGFPLWFLLRHVAASDAGSRIEHLLAGGYFASGHVLKCDIGGEFLYRVVRRYPDKVLACDARTRARIEQHACCNLLSRWPDGMGLLRAVGDTRFNKKVVCASSHIYPGEPEELGIRDALLATRKLESTRRFNAMTLDEKRAAILITQTKGYCHAASRIRREKDYSAKKLARASRFARPNYVGNDQ